MWDGILNGCAWLLYQLAQLVGDWGLAIIIVTLIIRIALSPLQRKQFRSSHEMKKMQPKIQRIQELYAGDQQKISEETMRIYQEVGFNPLAGCLPMLVQMPIFIILFQALRWKLVNYKSQGAVSFYNILPDLTLTVPEAGFQVAYCIFALLFIVLSVSPMIYQLVSGQMGEQQKGTQYTMLIFMGIMFIYMAWISPAGVILYWALSSAFGFVQQLIINKQLDKHDEEEEKELEPIKPVAVNVQRREHKKRPRKKS